MPTPPANTKFYTYKKNAQVAAKPGQIVEFTKGKGYWLYTPVTPPPPPPVGPSPKLPVGPFTKRTSTLYFDDATGHVISGYDIEGTIGAGANDGLLVMEWPPKLSTSRYTIKNIISQKWGNSPPTSNGTSEAGIWIGQSADVDSIVADGTWEALWTGAECADSIFTNFTIGTADGKGGFTGPSNAQSAGVYNEHFTRRTLFKNGWIYAPNARMGIISEWWYPDSDESGFVAKEFPGAKAGEAGSCMNTYDTLYVWCPKGGTGIYLDQGTWGTTVKNIVFDGPGNAYHEVGPLAGPTANVFDSASCTFKNGGSKGEAHLIKSDGDPNRKAPEKIAWREKFAA